MATLRGVTTKAAGGDICLLGLTLAKMSHWVELVNFVDALGSFRAFVMELSGK